MLLYRNASMHQHQLNEKYRIEIFEPSFLKLQQHKRFSLMHWTWYIFTRGTYKIIYIFDDNKIIHYTHAIPKFWKFRFMEHNDIEIGPCWTDESYRGEGIYPFVIEFVVNFLKNSYDSFFMMVSENNTASIQGIEKAGFHRIGEIHKSRFLGIYEKVEEYEINEDK